MNAIERLREAVNQASAAERTDDLDALAAVDALYQAAKEIAAYDAVTDKPGVYALVRWDEIAEFAAAVRRVEGE